jgi:hypothetical protein
LTFVLSPELERHERPGEISHGVLRTVQCLVEDLLQGIEGFRDGIARLLEELPSVIRATWRWCGEGQGVC